MKNGNKSRMGSDSANRGRSVSGPMGKIMCPIPNPLTIRQESTTEDNKRYSEEKDYRAEQLRLAKKLNRISTIGAVVSLLGLVGLGWTISESRISMEIDQRAWIGLSGVSLHSPYSAQRLGITAVFINTGKTPGKILWADIKVSSSPSPFSNRTKLESWRMDEISAPPNSPIPYSIVEQSAISEADFDLMQKRKIRHEFDIQIHYQDAFGKEHITENCIALLGIESEMSSPHNPFPSCLPNIMN